MAFSRTGGPEVLHLVDLPTPAPGPGEILLRVAYAGVNFGEIQHRLGDFGEPAGETVTGLEAAGVVAAVGEGMVAAVGTGERGPRTPAWRTCGSEIGSLPTCPTAVATPSTPSSRRPSPSRSPTPSTCAAAAARPSY